MSESTDYTGLACFSVSVSAGVAVVIIDHGEINLMDRDMMVELNSLAQLLESDSRVKVIIFRSANPDFFIAHADLNLILASQSADYDPEKRLVLMNHMVERFRHMPKVSIAQIEGQALGGGMELAIGLDMCFAGERARMGQPEVGLGIIPGGGGCARLPLRVGRARAMEIILGSQTFDAVQAERYGNINRVLPDEEIGGFVDELALRIASFPNEALAAVKRVININESASITERLIAEQVEFKNTSSAPSATQRMQRALDRGFQQYDIELGNVNSFLAGLGAEY